MPEKEERNGSFWSKQLFSPCVAVVSDYAHNPNKDEGYRVWITLIKGKQGEMDEDEIQFEVAGNDQRIHSILCIDAVVLLQAMKIFEPMLQKQKET